MTDIVTRCPQCNTAFRVTSNQLAVANGVVRCGSCLAVFKAIDNQADQTSDSATLAISSKDGTDKTAISIDESIKDEDNEFGLQLDDDVYDLQADKKNKKVSLFDRKLKTIDEPRRDNADESWALDMLADIDDDIEPIQIKRKPKPELVVREPEPPVEAPPPEPSTQEQKAPNTTPEPITALDHKNENTEEELFFDPDFVEEPQSRSTTPQKKNHSPIEANDDFVPISDEAIENAMLSRTSYGNEPKSYLANIESVPVEMEWYESENTQRRLWMGGAILLSLVLIFQTAAFRFDHLSKSNTWRPYYQTACSVLGCELPALIDTRKIRTTNLLVRSHPSQSGALIVDAILLNSAQFPQPFPALRLEFSDINNRLIAARNLQPNDYLRGELAGAQSMPANQPVQLSLEIVDPGDSAINYQLTVIKAASR